MRRHCHQFRSPRCYNLIDATIVCYLRSLTRVEPSSLKLLRSNSSLQPIADEVTLATAGYFVISKALVTGRYRCCHWHNQSMPCRQCGCCLFNPHVSRIISRTAPLSRISHGQAWAIDTTIRYFFRRSTCSIISRCWLMCCHRKIVVVFISKPSSVYAAILNALSNNNTIEVTIATHTTIAK